ncbi:MAG: CopG family transcriptional regulator [Candidatus Omnitrophota bacterium]
MDNQSNEYVQIPIPGIIVEKIKKRIKDTEFSTVSEYVMFILKEVLGEEDKKDMLTEEEEKEVKETLKKLGYLKDE